MTQTVNKVCEFLKVAQHGQFLIYRQLLAILYFRIHYYSCECVQDTVVN